MINLILWPKHFWKAENLIKPLISVAFIHNTVYLFILKNFPFTLLVVLLTH